MNREQKLKLAKAKNKIPAPAPEPETPIIELPEELLDTYKRLEEAHETTTRLLESRDERTEKLVAKQTERLVEVNNNLVAMVALIERYSKNKDVVTAITKLINKDPIKIPKEVTVKNQVTIPQWLASKASIQELQKTLQRSLDGIGNVIEENKQGQKPEDYVPFRRVYKLGNRLVFDDSTWASSTSGGGGTSNLQVGGQQVSATNPVPVHIQDAVIEIDTAGLATSAKQDTGNTSLSSIDGKIVAVNTGAVVVSSSALPTGASTSANQTTGNTSLASIKTNTDKIVTPFINATYDYIAFSTTSTTDVRAYKSGGSGGTIVATVTITYSDSTKTTVSNIART